MDVLMYSERKLSFCCVQECVPCVSRTEEQLIFGSCSSFVSSSSSSPSCPTPVTLFRDFHSCSCCARHMRDCRVQKYDEPVVYVGNGCEARNCADAAVAAALANALVVDRGRRGRPGIKSAGMPLFWLMIRSRIHRRTTNPARSDFQG